MRRTNSVVLTLACVGALAIASACSKADAASKTAGATAVSSAPPASPAAVTPTSAVLGARSLADSLNDSTIISRADRGRLLGPDSGAVWVVMISDFQCPYCKQWHDAVMDSVRRQYVNKGKVRMAYLNLPLPQHKYARAEAEAAMCAGVQGKFWPYAERLFKDQASVGALPAVQPLLETIARDLALDLPQFLACQKRDAIRSLVDSDIAQANKTGVRSTPSFLVGDFLVEGAIPFPDFRKAIDTALVLARNAKRTR
jgi:protein-disulfide isomerase